MAELSDDLWTWEKAELIDRVRELEGLVASTTRNLESCQRELADAMLNPEPVEVLGREVMPEHLARLDDAIARVASDLATAGASSDLWQHTDQGETRIAVLSSAILSIATARDRLSPKPLGQSR